jgi:hypothetical protein
MKSILDNPRKLNELRDIMFRDGHDLDLVEAEAHHVMESVLDNEIDDPWEAVLSYLGEYSDEYDVIGILNEVSTNDVHGNVILNPEYRNENGHLNDRFADACDAHHVELETYWLSTLSGMTIYLGTNRDDLVNAFISYMDEVHDTEAVVDYAEMLDIIQAGCAIRLEIIQELSIRPNAYLFYGHFC